MAQPGTYTVPDYSVVDSVWSNWALEHNLRFDCDYKGHAVRSIWWREKIQLWIDPPDPENHLLLNAAERRPDPPSQWGRSLKVRVQIDELAAALESVRSEAQSWVA